MKGEEICFLCSESFPEMFECYECGETICPDCGETNRDGLFLCYACTDHLPF